MVKYKVKKVHDKIYHVEFKDHYDLCMFFLRYQEFYESQNQKFRGKKFELLDFMAWYAKDHDGVFTYTTDWAGFNYNSTVIDKVNALGISDRNKYDIEMLKLHNKLKKEVGGNYYLIGTSTKCPAALNHEICHGLYYVNSKYKKEMNALVKKLPKRFVKRAYAFFKKVGYTKSVYVDEMQAYMATGFSHLGDDWEKYSKPFEDVFAKYKD